MNLDKIDATILSELTGNARASQVELAGRVGLSATAVARRQRALEEEGLIRGYQAVLDLRRFGLATTVVVRITLESQSDEALTAFEAGVLDCPSVVRCFLMSGSDDYVVIVLARDMSYSETFALAKEQEEALLYAAMQSEIVMQVLRRLSAVPKV